METKGFILEVRRIERVDGDFGCKCPHCKNYVTFPSGPIRGEQFTCNRCKELFEVTSTAKILGV